MHKTSADQNYAHSLNRLKHYLGGLRNLSNGYAKHLKTRKIFLIVGPDGEVKKFPLRRKENGWVELGSHDKRRPRKQKCFPGRFSLATGESLDRFEGWRLVPDTAENLEAATVYADARKYRITCPRVPPSRHPEYAAVLPLPSGNGRRPTRELEDLVGPYLRMSPADRRALIGMMETDAQRHEAAGLGIG